MALESPRKAVFCQAFYSRDVNARFCLKLMLDRAEQFSILHILPHVWDCKLQYG